MEYYFKCFREYVNFSGRARRSEYWYFTLFSSIVTITLFIIGALIFGYHNTHTESYPPARIFYDIYTLVAFLPALGVAVRRLHDTNRSGWWIFICLIPLVGAIVLLIFDVQDSDPGDNNYGPNPKLNDPIQSPIT